MTLVLKLGVDCYLKTKVQQGLCFGGWEDGGGYGQSQPERIKQHTLLALLVVDQVCGRDALPVLVRTVAEE
jgi:hypothetical protein